jgi:peptidoglycan hydrolase FlgJ
VAITPPSDIVLDVARAADPERYRLAVDQLARLRATAAAANDASIPPGGPGASAGSVANAGPPGRNPRRPDAYGQFEAFVLQSFLQSMLPRNASNVYGRGTAGEVWRSMLAEQLGGQLASSGQVGIARRLAAGAPRPGPEAANASAPPPGLSPAQLSALSSIPPHDGAEVSTAPPPPGPVRS